MAAPDLPLIPPRSPGPVLAAYSGGLDSTVLLHRLASDPALRARGLRAVHVHHGLQADADDWATHCANTCAALGIALDVRRIRIEDPHGLGPEAAAREARHGVFQALLRPGEVLALAHHRDDQAETFLLRALRASGVDGLAAMAPWRACGPGWLWRPLLDTPHAALRDWALARGLRWIEDPSNAGSDPDRNFLRHEVLPRLHARWPQAAAALARSAALAAQARTLLDDEDAMALAGARGADPAVLRIEALRALPPARRARVLRRWIADCALPPLPAAGVDRIESSLLTAGPDAAARFEWAGARVRRWRGLLHAAPVRPPLPAAFSAAWDGRQPLRLPTGDLLALEDDGDAPGFDAPLRVHARRGGERLRLPGRAHRHALKDVLQALGVPPWERERLPLLSDAAGDLLAAGDLVYAAHFDAWLRARRARLRWRPAAHAAT
ncbi:tRNA lysidine(34) synthetase TilS [Luteimonas huabeiensis]|uniref:tRNA lysidine(34) synthetase TilS n=1 Tax=Luteimonas huabeiensis TaxID=1244513 RepID=UPI0004663F07|nr:tRNA lysidine(34) synthetase TilS [Luteimonas huabeiensis]